MLRGLLLGLLAVVAVGCLPPPFRIAGDGGVAGAGDAPGTAGATGTAGASGAPGTGGGTGTGGRIGVGGAMGAGGVTGTGGAAGGGGRPGAGGTVGTGGRSGTGGVAGTGGITGVGGAANPPDASVDMGGDSSPATGLNAGLIGYWTFDQAASVYPDRSGNGNDARLNPPSVAPTWIQSTRPGAGGALVFTQSPSSTVAASWLEVAPSASLNSVAHSFTMAAWLLMPAASVFSPSGIITRQVDLEKIYGMELSMAGALELVLSGGTVTPPLTDGLPTTQWVHVATTYDGVTANLYIAGQLKKAGALVGSTAAFSDHALFIGAENDDAIGVVNGLSATIDDLLFYNRVLSAGEIAALAAGVTPVVH